jgi:hypothetical protein
MYLAVVLLTSSTVWSAQAGCPADAVFLAAGGEVRGYPLRANGAVEPCQVIGDPNTPLGAVIAVGPGGSLHVSQFLSNGGQVKVFAASASGGEAPLRTALTFTNDHVSLAVDRWGNDFVLARETVVFLPHGTVGAPSPRHTMPAGDVASIATDRDGHLLAAGWDQNGAFVKTFDTSVSIESPTLLRKITGPATGFFVANFRWGSQSDLDIAVDPVSQEVYVYNSAADHSDSQVSVFAADADGNAAPIRTLHGPATGIGSPGGIGTNKIAVSSDGRLFVAEPDDRILVFAPGATGDVAPSQVIVDASFRSDHPFQGGIAVRSCSCQEHKKPVSDSSACE